MGIDPNVQEIIWGFSQEFQGVRYSSISLPKGLGVGSSISVYKGGFLVTTGSGYILVWEGEWRVFEKTELYGLRGTPDGYIGQRFGALVKHGHGHSIEIPYFGHNMKVSKSGFVATLDKECLVVFDMNLSNGQTLANNVRVIEFAGDQLISANQHCLKRWEYVGGQWLQTGSIPQFLTFSSASTFCDKLVISEAMLFRILDFNSKEVKKIDVEDMKFAQTVLMPCGRLVYQTLNGIGFFDMSSGVKKNIPINGNIRSMTVSDGVLIILFPDRVEHWF